MADTDRRMFRYTVPVAEWVATCPRTPEGLVFHLYELPAPKEVS